MHSDLLLSAEQNCKTKGPRLTWAPDLLCPPFYRHPPPPSILGSQVKGLGVEAMALMAKAVWAPQKLCSRAEKGKEHWLKGASR